MAEITDIGTLLLATQSGGRVKFLFFWGHRPERSGSPGRGCLSQWWPGSFELDGVGYPTAEHFMMAEKARLFGDENARATILAAPHPGAAKALGRRVAGFDETVWKAHRFEIVVRGNEAKFSQNPELLAFLVQTKERILVEASPRDRVWGIGLAADDPRAAEPSRWPGLNLLGFALMEVRRRLTGATRVGRELAQRETRPRR